MQKLGCKMSKYVEGFDVNQQNIFEEKQDYIKLQEIILDVKEEMDFMIYAYCFMTNHVHIQNMKRAKKCSSQNGFEEAAVGTLNT